jgi:hypothetical protein
MRKYLYSLKCPLQAHQLKYCLLVRLRCRVNNEVMRSVIHTQDVIPSQRQDVTCIEVGCHAKMRQDVAARIVTHKNIVPLLALILPGCRQAASHRLAKRRCTSWSGRRDSNPRQPAWKADRREITARLLSSSFRRAFSYRTRHPSSTEADGRAQREADGYLLSLPIIPASSQECKHCGKDVRAIASKESSHNKYLSFDSQNKPGCPFLTVIFATLIL